MTARDRTILQLQAHPGQPLDIVLDAQAAAGLAWRAPPAPPGCLLAPADPQPGGAGDGAGVQQRFVFTASATGAYTLRFALQRPWDDTPLAVQPVAILVG